MADHAVLSASSGRRWTECPPSAVLNAKAGGDGSSPYAQEGTDAHALGQYLIEKEFGIPTEDPTADLTYYNAEMQECAEVYLQTVREIAASVDNPKVYVEQKVSFARWVPEGFGTADCIILAEGIVNVIDYKHGAGVFVSCEDNVQMKLYALGVVDMFDGIFDIEEIRMTIVQPRMDNISTWGISKAKLLKWADDYLAPRAQLAAKGKGEFKAGPHCQFCKVKATCRKRAEANLELAQLDFRQPPELTDEEIALVLTKIDDLVAWSNDVKEYALSQALSGKHYEGFKLVAGRSIRKYTDEAAVADAVKAAGYDPFEQKLMGITSMEKLLGKKLFGEILGDLTVKPQGKPTLVSINDKRPELNSAAEDFTAKQEEQL